MVDVPTMASLALLLACRHSGMRDREVRGDRGTTEPGRLVQAAALLGCVAIVGLGCTPSSSRASTNVALFTQGTPDSRSASGVLTMMQTVPKPGPPTPNPLQPLAAASASELVSSASLPFQSAASSFREQVQLLETAPASYGPESVRRAVATLADALESVPFPHDVDVVGAAQTMREEFPDDVGGGQRDAGTASRQVRRALKTAAGALFLLAHGPYASSSHFGEGADQFVKAAEAIEPDQSVPAQHHAVVTALRSASDALYDFEWPSRVATQPSRASTGAPAEASAAARPGPPSSERPAAVGAAEPQGAEQARGPFARTLSLYSAAVDRYVLRRSDQGPDALYAAFGALADALDAIPDRNGPGGGAASTGAASIRAMAGDFNEAAAGSIEQSIIARRLFETAGAALAVVSERNAGPSPRVAAAIRDLRRASQSIGDEPLQSQGRALFESLQAAEQTLRAVAMTTTR